MKGICSSPNKHGCCPKGETLSVDSAKEACVEQELHFDCSDSLVYRSKSVFQGPAFNVDIEFKDLSYSVKINRHGKAYIIMKSSNFFL